MRRLPRLRLVAGFALAGNTLGATLAIVMPALAPPITTATEAVPAQVVIVEPPFRPPTTWKYEPAVLTVKVGTTVTWTNIGAVVHTVTAADRKAFDSKNIGPNASFSWTFQSAGTFAYLCTYHPWMKGTIIAQP